MKRKDKRKYFSLYALCLTVFISLNARAQTSDWLLEIERSHAQISGGEIEPDKSLQITNTPAASDFDLFEEETGLSEVKTQTSEDLKQQMLELNRDLLILEEELLFPVSTQVSVYLSMDVGNFFELDAVRLEIDGELAAAHLYTETQLDALHRGGVQRLHLGNIKSGAHEFVAFFTGKGTHEREYKRAASIEISKNQKPLVLELVISDSEKKLQPEFTFQTVSL